MDSLYSFIQRKWNSLTHLAVAGLCTDYTDEQRTNAGRRRTMGTTPGYNYYHSLQPGQCVGPPWGLWMNGEPWEQHPATITVTHYNQASVLARPGACEWMSEWMENRRSLQHSATMTITHTITKHVIWRSCIVEWSCEILYVVKHFFNIDIDGCIFTQLPWFSYASAASQMHFTCSNVNVGTHSDMVVDHRVDRGTCHA